MGKLPRDKPCHILDERSARSEQCTWGFARASIDALESEGAPRAPPSASHLPLTSLESLWLWKQRSGHQRVEATLAACAAERPPSAVLALPGRGPCPSGAFTRSGRRDENTPGRGCLVSRVRSRHAAAALNGNLYFTNCRACSSSGSADRENRVALCDSITDGRWPPTGRDCECASSWPTGVIVGTCLESWSQGR